MTEAEQRKIAETLFAQTHEEIRDAIKLEEERRAALVKNLYRMALLVKDEPLRMQRPYRNQQNPHDSAAAS